MLIGFNQPIWLYQQPIDFRKQIDGLVILVADQLNLNPTSGQLFIFRNRQSNKIKLLWWDNNGFWLFYKRIEKGRFKLPKISDASINLSKDQLSVLLAGLNFMEQKHLEPVTAKQFF